MCPRRVALSGILLETARAKLTVNGDDILALTFVMALNAEGSGPGWIARELALAFGESSSAPRVSQHIPGIANVTSDILSRRLSSKRMLPWRLPQALEGIEETQPSLRDMTLDRTLNLRALPILRGVRFSEERSGRLSTLLAVLSSLSSFEEAGRGVLFDKRNILQATVGPTDPRRVL